MSATDVDGSLDTSVEEYQFFFLDLKARAYVFLQSVYDLRLQGACFLSSRCVSVVQGWQGLLLPSSEKRRGPQP